MGGKVLLDHAFDDIAFPTQKRTTVPDVMRSTVGIHHTKVHRVRTLWTAYEQLHLNENLTTRTTAREPGGEGVIGVIASGSDSSSAPIFATQIPFDPSLALHCTLDKRGNPTARD